MSPRSSLFYLYQISSCSITVFSSSKSVLPASHLIRGDTSKVTGSRGVASILYKVTVRYQSDSLFDLLQKGEKINDS